jgi:hypothetical protein
MTTGSSALDRLGRGLRVGPPAGDNHNIGEAMRRIGRLRSHIRNDKTGKLILAESVDDILRAKAEGKLAVGIHLEGFRCLERDLNLIEIYYQLGVRFCHPIFNLVNSIGGGCADRIDIGLTNFGLKVIREMNRVGMLVDGAHAGYRTTLDMMEHSEAPVVFHWAVTRFASISGTCATTRSRPAPRGAAWWASPARLLPRWTRRRDLLRPRRSRGGWSAPCSSGSAWTDGPSRAAAGLHRRAPMNGRAGSGAPAHGVHQTGTVDRRGRADAEERLSGAGGTRRIGENRLRVCKSVGSSQSTDRPTDRPCRLTDSQAIDRELDPPRAPPRPCSTWDEAGHWLDQLREQSRK